MARSSVALLAALLWTAVPGVVHAHDEHRFEPVADIAAKVPSGRVVFFPLADDFEKSSPYGLVPAGGRRVVWTPESTELPEAATPEPVVRAIGSPPPQPEAARYLVPVLDGAGAGLEFVPRRLDGGRLVPYEGTPRPGLDVVPILSGPQLDATPSETPPARVLGAPVEADAGELSDVVPAFLVRKATPSRVVFGVRLGVDIYVALVDEAGLAVMARRDGKLGLAAPVPEGVKVATLPDDAPADDEDDTGWTEIAAVAAAASVAVGGLGFVAWRRGARRR